MKNEEIETAMESLLGQLSVKRELEKGLAEQYKQARIEFEARYAELANARVQLQTEMEMLRKDITEAGKELYARVGNKQLPGGLRVRLLTEFEYEDEDALAWCKKHEMFLSFDKKAFEKFLRDTPAVEVNFVTFISEIQVTIPSEIHLADAQTSPSLERSAPGGGAPKVTLGDALRENSVSSGDSSGAVTGRKESPAGGDSASSRGRSDLDSALDSSCEPGEGSQ